jgi:hypothetical protein
MGQTFAIILTLRIFKRKKWTGMKFALECQLDSDENGQFYCQIHIGCRISYILDDVGRVQI